jgi:hypothetical protein
VARVPGWVFDARTGPAAVGAAGRLDVGCSRRGA